MKFETFDIVKLIGTTKRGSVQGGVAPAPTNEPTPTEEPIYLAPNSAEAPEKIVVLWHDGTTSEHPPEDLQLVQRFY